MNTEKACYSCGGQQEISFGKHIYSKSLDVVLENAMLFTCSDCGDIETGVTCSASLHEAIAERIARSKGRLNSKQIRFLRKHLGLRSKELATVLGVKPETVSRWENKDSERLPSPPAEKLLRLLALTDFDTSEILDFGCENPSTKAINLKFREDDHQWVDICEPDTIENRGAICLEVDWNYVDFEMVEKCEILDLERKPEETKNLAPGFMNSVNNTESETGSIEMSF